MQVFKKYLEFQSSHRKFFILISKILTILAWVFFIIATIAQIYFNLVPFDQAVNQVNQITNVDVDKFFTIDQNIFFNLTLVNLYKNLFDVIFLSSAVVAFIGTWVLSQGRNLWEAFLLFLTLAIPRIRREWGLVYDESTGKPIEFAIIRLYSFSDNNKVFIGQSISDLDGRYRIFLPEVFSNFVIEVSADNYATSFQELSRKKSNINFFDEELALIRSGETKQSKFSFARLKSKIKIPVTNLVFLLSTIVTIHSTYGMLAIPQVDTYFFFFFYGIAWIWNIRVLLSRRKKIEGRILSLKSNQPVVGVFLRLFDLNKNFVTTEITDSRGLANFKVKADNYLLQVSRKNVKSINQTFIEVEINTKGSITKDIKVSLENPDISTESIPNPFN